MNASVMEEGVGRRILLKHTEHGWEHRDSPWLQPNSPGGKSPGESQVKSSLMSYAQER